MATSTLVYSQVGRIAMHRACLLNSSADNMDVDLAQLCAAAVQQGDGRSAMLSVYTSVCTQCSQPLPCCSCSCCMPACAAGSSRASILLTA
jgi:hypothetical protein